MADVDMTTKTGVLEPPLSVATGGAMGGVLIGFFLTSQLSILFIFAVIFGLASFLLRSVVRSLLIVFLSVSVSAWFLRIAMATFEIQSVSIYIFISFTLLLLTSAIVGSRNYWTQRSWLDSAQARGVCFSVLAVWLFLSWPSRSNPLYYVFLMGEDNGSVLDASAKFLREASLTPATFSNGGWLTGALQSLAVFTSTRGSPEPSAALEVIDAVTRTYALFAALTSLVFSIALLNVLSQGQNSVKTRLWPYAWAGVGTAASLPFILGTIQWGHLSALIAMLCVLVLVTLSGQLDTQLRVAERMLLATSLVVAAVSLGGAWYPLQPISIALAAGIVVRLLWWVVRDWRKWSRFRLAFLVFALGLLIVLGVNYSLSFKYLLNTENVLRIIQYGGGVARIGQPILLLILVGTIWLAVTTVSTHLRWVIYSLITYLLVLYSISYFQGATPQYGAAKTALIVLGALTPFAIGIFTLKCLVGTRNLGQALMAVVVGVSAVFVIAAEPFSSFATIVANRPRSEDYQGIRSSLNDSSRTTVCLATEQGFEYSSYKCSRVLLGAQGLHDSPLRVFVGGNLCGVDSLAIKLLPTSVLENLRIIVSNPERLTTYDNCGSRGWAGEAMVDDPTNYVLGWTTHIPWGKVELRDQLGNIVQPSFSYLSQYGDYEESEIAALQLSLNGD